jgi:hypothetical protein
MVVTITALPGSRSQALRVEVRQLLQAPALVVTIKPAAHRPKQKQRGEVWYQRKPLRAVSGNVQGQPGRVKADRNGRETGKNEGKVWRVKRILIESNFII